MTDEQIVAAKEVVDRAGVGCEPASAASVAGIRRLVEEEIIREGDRVVAVLTGHLLKDPGAVLDDEHLSRIVTVEPTADAVTRAVMTS